MARERGSNHRAARRTPLLLGAVAAIVVVAVAAGAMAKRGGSDDAVPLFIFAGQSNMVGLGTRAADIPADLRKAAADARIWNVARRRWEPVPLGSDAQIGPEASALGRLAQRLGRTVVGVKVAFGGTTLARDWDASRKDALYAQLKAAVDDALLAEVPGHGLPRVAGFFWMQGESDAEEVAAGAAYATNLTRLVQTVRTDFADRRLPCVFGRIRVEQPSAKVGGDQVRVAYGKVARALPPATVVDTDDLPMLPDYVHYQSKGIVTLGRRFADAWSRVAE